jgi:hypothetical protein
VLGALKARHVCVGQVLDADREGQLDTQLASLTPRPEHALLWPAVEAWLGPKAGRNVTVKRYGVSIVKLRRLSELPADARVSDLAALDWRALGQAKNGGDEAGRLRLGLEPDAASRFPIPHGPPGRLVSPPDAARGGEGDPEAAGARAGA